MKRRPLVSPGTLNRMLHAAEEAWNRRDFQQAIELLESASRRDPANSLILLDLGRMYGMRYDFTAAERCFDKAIRVAPKKAEALTEAGQRCREFDRYEMAERYFRTALEQKEVSPETFVKLAEVYERLRRLDEAGEFVNRALHADPNCAAALLVRARLDRQAGQLGQAERLLQSFLKTTASTAVRIQGFYELGGILDRLKRHDEAMTAFVEGKGLQQKDAPRYTVELGIMRARLAELRTSLSAETLQRWFDTGAAIQPVRRVALLGGHPRSGTTLLEQVLDSHPDMVSAEETTIFYDDAYMTLARGVPPESPMMSVLDSAQPDLLRQARDHYFQSVEKFLGKAIGNRLLIDKNPSLTFLIPAIIRVFPESKFLIALRDPRDVCLSCFMQHMPLSQVSSAYLSLESTIEEYVSLMTMWRTVAPLMKNPWLEVRYEDMVNDLESVARRVLDFLGVPWNPGVLGFDEHARNKLVRSPTYADVTKPIFKTAVGRWRAYQKYLEPYLERLEPFVKAFGYE